MYRVPLLKSVIKCSLRSSADFNKHSSSAVPYFPPCPGMYGAVHCKGSIMELKYEVDNEQH